MPVRKWDSAAKKKAEQPFYVPFVLEDLPITNMAWRDDVDHSTQCDEHTWVRSIITSGRREMGKTQPIYWQVDESVVWCETCGKPFVFPKDHKPAPVERRVRSASDYYAIMNPERESYQGIDETQYEGWLPKVATGLITRDGKIVGQLEIA